MKNNTKPKLTLALLLFILCIFNLTSCSNAQKISIEEFEKKYKRASFEDFIANPREFIQDFNATKLAFRTTKYYDESYLDNWSVTDYAYEYERETILFNRNAVFSIFVSKLEDDTDNRIIVYGFSLSFSTGNIIDNIKIGTALTDELFNIYGDAKSITIGMEKSTESELRKMLNSNDIRHYYITFGNKYDDKAHLLWEKYEETEDENDLKAVQKAENNKKLLHNNISVFSDEVSLS